MLEELKKRFFTGLEFEAGVESLCKEKGCRVVYSFCDSLEEFYTYGESGEGDVKDQQSPPLGVGYSDLKVQLWRGESEEKCDDWSKLFMTYWNKDFLDTITGLPGVDKPEMKDKCNQTLKYYRSENQKVAVIMIDLDHFKDVNDSVGHQEANKVLSEVAQRLYRSFVNIGIVLHQSGDEFNVIMPYNDLTDVVRAVKNARDAIMKIKFGDNAETGLTIAVGVKCIEGQEVDFDDARTAAERAYQPIQTGQKNKSKQRDSIRIDLEERALRSDTNLKFAWTRLISNLDGRILGNVFLEYIKRVVATIEKTENLEEKIKDIVHWINPNMSNNNLRCSVMCGYEDSLAEFSVVEVCFSAMQGLLINPNFKENHFICKASDKEIVIKMDDNEIYHGSLPCVIDDFEGICQDFYRNNASRACKRIILIQAGYEPVPMPTDVFCDIVQVDTRPTTGGGLPDFWEAALSKLISLTKAYPVVSDILIYGDISHTKYIEAVLDSIEKWNRDVSYSYKYLSRKTFQSVEDIIDFQEKFTNRIHTCVKDLDLYNRVNQIYGKDIEISEAPIIACETSRKKRILNRTLSYHDIMLGINDGCRVKSLSDAYPTVLEIIRSEWRNNHSEILDQAGRKLYELTDFKIVLTAPDSRDLPFYFMDDRGRLEDYYRKVFADEEALFGKMLNAEEQLDAMIQHVAEVLNKKKRYATRRAALVVSNKIDREAEYAPLGLLSVWLSPRFTEDEVVIDFSYNWRTVEAVVGFPLSLYASVRFAEELTVRIAGKVKAECMNIRLGAVSYIAHSLHMYLEEENQGIIRGIIDDASI